MVNDAAKIDRWVNRFNKEFLAASGQDIKHLLVVGYTGSGKTTALFYVLEGLVSYHPEDTFVWFDMPKASESLALSLFKPCRYIVPYGCTLTIQKNNTTDKEPYETEIIVMEKPEDIYDPWKYLRRGWINIMCIEPFIIDPPTYSTVVAEVIKNLIISAQDEKIIVPLRIFIDEVHTIAPSSGASMGKEHTRAGNLFRHNAERLRAFCIQLIGSTQMYTELKFPVRRAFGFKILKSGAVFSKYDEPKLAEANKHWGTLGPREMVIVFDNRDYSDDIIIYYYPKGLMLGHLKYVGRLNFNKKGIEIEAEAIA